MTGDINRFINRLSNVLRNYLSKGSFFFDDFLGYTLNNIYLTEVSGTGSLGIQNLPNGVFRLATGTTSGSVAACYLGGTGYLQWDYAKGIYLKERVRLPGALTDLEAWFGLSALDGSNHVMWCARPAVSGNFRCEVMTDALTYSADSGVPLDNAWHDLEIFTYSDRCEFVIDGGDTITISQVPNANMCLEYYITNTVPASRELDLDYIFIQGNRM